MKVATFNANSIRVRLDAVLDWLASNPVDVLAIQETKCEDDKFPRDAFEDVGLHVAFHGQKTYNGVAIVSPHPIANVRTGFGQADMPDDCRLIYGEVLGLKVLNSYVPNGSKVGSEKFIYKLHWLSRFRDLCDRSFSSSDPIVWMGDINIAPKPEDVFDSPSHLGAVGHHPDEFAALEKIVEWGWTDLFRKFTEESGHYTYWDFFIKNAPQRKLGWRIDHIYASPVMASKCSGCVIDIEPRLLERPSDHTFVVAEFDW